MTGIDLEELLGIWEQWTDHDPLLRQALQRTTAPGPAPREVVEHVVQQLDPLAYDAVRTDATTAALYAGWVVLVALDGTDETDQKWYQNVARIARLAHQQALGDMAVGA